MAEVQDVREQNVSGCESRCLFARVCVHPAAAVSDSSMPGHATRMQMTSREAVDGGARREYVHCTIADAAWAPHTSSQVGRSLRANIEVRAGITRMHEKLCVVGDRIEIAGTSMWLSHANTSPKLVSMCSGRRLSEPQEAWSADEQGASSGQRTRRLVAEQYLVL